MIFAEIARRRSSGERGLDILSLLLDAEDEDGSRLSDEELRDQVMTLLFAGHDAATSTVTFLFYELARNPDEIAPLADDDDRLDMAIDETLRMYPPAWIGPRRWIAEFELAGVRVPAGVFVNYCSWASHHLPDVFDEPERFRPDRFTPEARAELPKGAYVPFGGGSRTCIGMRFGQLEVKMMARSILSRFGSSWRSRNASCRSARCRRSRRAAGCRWSCARATDGRCLARTGDLHVVSVALCQLS